MSAMAAEMISIRAILIRSGLDSCLAGLGEGGAGVSFGAPW